MYKLYLRVIESIKTLNVICHGYLVHVDYVGRQQEAHYVESSSSNGGVEGTHPVTKRPVGVDTRRQQTVHVVDSPAADNGGEEGV